MTKYDTHIYMILDLFKDFFVGREEEDLSFARKNGGGLRSFLAPLDC